MTFAFVFFLTAARKREKGSKKESASQTDRQGGGGEIGLGFKIGMFYNLLKKSTETT